MTRPLLALLAVALLAPALAAADGGAVVPWTEYDPAKGESTMRTVAQYSGLGAELKPAEKDIVARVLYSLEKEAKRLREKDGIYPGQGYAEAATEIDARLQTLKHKDFRLGFEVGGAQAYVSDVMPNTVFVTPKFFEAPSLLTETDRDKLTRYEKTHLNSTLRERLDLAKTIRLNELGGILLHEGVHSEQQNVLSTRREQAAYIMEYRFLRLMNDDHVKDYNALAKQDGSPTADTIEMGNVLDWLWATDGITGADKTTPSQERAARDQLDPVLGITNDTIFPKDLEDKLRARLPKEPELNLPDGRIGKADAARRRREIEQWRDTWMKELAVLRENDPQRARNREAFERRMKDFRATAHNITSTCPHCGFYGVHYWLEDRWSCSNCEFCRFPSDVLGPGGGNETYKSIANQRRRVYDDRRYTVWREAERLLAELDRHTER